MRPRSTSWTTRGLVGLALLVTACGPRSQGPALDAAPSQVSLIDDGEKVLASATAVRADLVAASEKLGAAAVAEGGTARGVVLATLAGRLRARAFRLGGGLSEDDARRALEWWTVAIGRPEFAEACAPAIERAELAGEIAHDPRVSYRELYAARRRLTSSPCVASIDEALDRSRPWRPPPEALAQLDRALAGEGVIGALAGLGADAGTSNGAHARVLRVSRWSTADSARVVIELDKPATYLLEPATPGTVRVRLEGVDLAGAAEDIDEAIGKGKGLLIGGKLAPIPAIVAEPGAPSTGSPGGTAVVLSLARPAYRRIFFLPDPFRVVVDLSTTPPQVAEGTGPRPLRRIVLDAGHGGSDPGATGPSGLQEKNVTLALAKAAAPIVARELGVEVRLTRAADTFVSLEERAAIANGAEADVFLSIHCNASPSPKAHGMEIYVLDTARDEITQKVAARENGGGAAAPGELRAILDDLKLQELGGRSQQLAALLQKATMASLGPSYPDVVDGGVHGAGFFVLVGARMPAALMEVTYISNAKEEAHLADAEFQARMVDAIVNGLRAYQAGT